MTVDELWLRLQQLRIEGKGHYEVLKDSETDIDNVDLVEEDTVEEVIVLI